MKFTWSIFFFILLFSGCSRLDQLEWDITPNQWLETHSFSEINIGLNSLIISEPSSSIIVFVLGAILVIMGINILKKRYDEKSKLIMGLGFIVWGISTFLAGISYQAFSYMLKCQGREISLWTTWFEIWYLILFVLSMNLIASAVAYSSCNLKKRKLIINYAKINTLLYTLLVLTGAFIPNRFMVSFECMVIFIGPTFVSLLIINLRQYKIGKKLLDKRYATSWVLLFVIVLIYFIVSMSSMASTLWGKGIWFNANDTLHIGLIIWVFYYIIFVEKLTKDY